ncbi:unnamed protein product [Periconia digitata]|uniref:Uncharacterized protein n=1 Tax=Periconia digitata TaxID=1303443 RepID=A0A9W4U9E3_9PLEO|nr:unnamed protein product [Periconia digitata]
MHIYVYTHYDSIAQYSARTTCGDCYNHTVTPSLVQSCVLAQVVVVLGEALRTSRRRLNWNYCWPTVDPVDGRPLSRLPAAKATPHRRPRYMSSIIHNCSILGYFGRIWLIRRQ